MSSAKVKGSAGSLPSAGSANSACDVEECYRPDFIYGGPWVKVDKPEPLLNTATPRNIQLQGTFKKSFAYYSLKERMPVILTKVIDYASRQGAKGGGNVQEFIKHVAKLKSDLVTNKKYDKFTVDTSEAKKWNTWIQNCDVDRYFTNTWAFTECYIYRRIAEACELTNMNNFDVFEEQKTQALTSSMELMCTVADKVIPMLEKSEKDKRKADFIMLLKICLWSNKCDMSLSAGEPASLTGGAAEGKAVDPFQLIIDWKDKLVIDDTGKIFDQLTTKAENMAKAVEGNTTFKFQCSCHRLATLAGVPICNEKIESVPGSTVGSRKGSPPATPGPAPPLAEGEEAPKIPCPAKITIPKAVMFDIVCDNAGYELFADLCLAHFMIAQNMVQKVRFHVKKIPWFVSDVTRQDFNFLIDSCAAASYTRTIEADPKPAPPEGETPPAPEPPTVITADSVKQLAGRWKQFVDEGTFIVLSDDFWTSPHYYKDMKKYDFNLYRKLQLAVAILFKGDLNYRKLLAEKNCNPYTGFEASLQGFIPAPIIAARTVKAELICGMPKGKFEVISKLDQKWMEKGDYGLIQFCPKAEALKVSDSPCMDYGETCFGEVCPIHNDL